MKQLHCPLNGLRNIDEFVYGGEYHPDEAAAEIDARAWHHHSITSPAQLR